MMKAKVAIVAMAMLAMFGVGAASGTPSANAQCGNFVALGNGGGQCDGPFYPDGSFQRCVTVFVLGIGGTNCFIVPPPR